MTRPYGPLYRELLNLKGNIDSLAKKLKRLKSKSSSSLGCATFTAKHGSSIISQLNAEIDFLDKKMNQHRFRGLEGKPLDTRIINSTHSVLKSYIQKDTKEVEDGMVRQYFASDVELIVEPIEFPIEHLQRRIGKGQPASTYAMMRQQTFNISSLAEFLKSNQKNYASMEAEMKSSVEKLILKLGDSNSGPHKWSESATDSGSVGGFLVCTNSNQDYKLLFCPDCSQKLIKGFNQGIRGIVFPPLPKTVLNLKVFCTENEHKNHSYEDCIGVDELEARINQVREQLHVPTHHTEVISIPNQQLSKSHGDWIWLRHN
jgi:hypothetical protein